MNIRVLAAGVIATDVRHGREMPIVQGFDMAAEEARVRAVFNKLGDRYGTRAQTAIRFALANPDLSCVVVGFAEIGHIEEALAGAELGPLPDDGAGGAARGLRRASALGEASLRIEAVETILASLPLPGPAWGDSIHHVTHIEILVADVPDRYRPRRHRLQLYLGRRRHVAQGAPGQGPGATASSARRSRRAASGTSAGTTCTTWVAAASRRRRSRRSTSPFGTWSRRR